MYMKILANRRFGIKPKDKLIKERFTNGFILD